jgi:hypothetical protein
MMVWALGKQWDSVSIDFIMMVLYIKLHIAESQTQSKELQKISISKDCVKSCKISDVMTLMIFLLF